MAVGPVTTALAITWAAAIPTDTTLRVFVGRALLARRVAREAAAHFVELGLSFENRTLRLGCQFRFQLGDLRRRASRTGQIVGVNGGLLEGEEGLVHWQELKVES
jgi:hypothetical protein